MATLGVFTRATSPDEDKSPFGNILAAVMRSNAMIQGQAQATDLAKKQMADPQPKVTLQANPNGGAPLVDIKGITADQLNGQQGADLQKAHDTPHVQVEQKLNQMGIGSFQDAALRSVGYTPHRTDVTGAELGSSFGADYRAQRDMGESIPGSLVKGALTRLGLFNRERVADEANRTAALKNAGAFKATVTPEIQAETELMSAGRAAQLLAFEANRARIADTKEARMEFNDAIGKIDYGKVSFANWRSETENALGHPITDAEFARVQDKGNRDVNANLDTFLGKGNPAQRATLGSYDTFQDVVTSYGGEIPPRRQREMYQAWQTARKEYVNKDSKERATIDAMRTKNQQTSEREQSAEDVAGAIIRGDQPPDLSRLYGMAGLVRGKLAKQGYNLTQATEDWTATQAYLKTLNSSQQVRLRQAVSFTYDSLNVVEDLAKQWDAGGFPVLNKARLTAAANGALGQKAQSIATRLQSQINDMVSELAMVYSGGNASTDEKLKTAAANLNADWSKQTLLDNIAQVRQNLGIRKNSITSIGVGGVSNNQYEPKKPAPPRKSGDFKKMSNSDLFSVLQGNQ